MKSFYLSLILVVGMFLGACSQNDDVMQPKTSENYQASELVQRLQNFNDSLLSNRPESRLSWADIGRICFVAAHDAYGAYKLGKIGAQVGSFVGPEGTIVGAAVGGVIGGVGASYGAYSGTRSGYNFPSPQTVVAAYVTVLEDSLVYSNYYPSKFSLVLPSGKSTLQDIGAAHNLVLSNLMDNVLSNTPANNVLTSLEYSILFSHDYISEYYEILNDLESNGFSAGLSSNDPIDDQVFNLYLNALTSYPTQVSDIELISNQYVNLVDQSDELTTNEKDIIYRGICVAVSSYEFWEPILYPDQKQ
ncbi:MAG: hypothetical protein LIP02_00845 [Bacteroidales bacterium]|nr:hypothetical protein [Bacteroidales bacterium]